MTVAIDLFNLIISFGWLQSIIRQLPGGAGRPQPFMLNSIDSRLNLRKGMAQSFGCISRIEGGGTTHAFASRLRHYP